MENMFVFVFVIYFYFLTLFLPSYRNVAANTSGGAQVSNML